METAFASAADTEDRPVSFTELAPGRAMRTRRRVIPIRV